MQTKIQKQYDLREILKPYANKWVALSSDRSRVLGSGESLENVAAKITQQDAVFMRVLPANTRYAPVGL